MRPGIRDRKRIVRAIARLSDRDFDMVVFYLLGDEAERETALKLLQDITAGK